MIIVRFFTGVVVKYPAATLMRKHPDGTIEICKGENRENAVVIASLQPTAGAIVETGPYHAIMTTPQNIEDKSVWERVFGHKGGE